MFTYNRNFDLWTVTNQTDFQTGVLNNVDINSSPGDVKIGTSSSWLAGYSYRKSITIAHSDGVYANTGGTITTDGAYTVHTFTSGGTFTAGKSGTVEVLVVAGGGGGGGIAFGNNRGAGGGGAGGFRSVSSYAVTPQSYTVVVGAGGSAGTGGTNGGSGGNSAFSTITANGGGGGASSSFTNGVAGGSGGGGRWTSGIGGSGNTPVTTPSQGNRGGNTSSNGAGGGGGASAVGADATGDNGAAGGAGTVSAINGTSVTYAGGGGGGGYGVAGGAGGAGGGGSAPASRNVGNPGTNGLGGGGSGATGSNSGVGSARSGGGGGSGVVIVRCLTTDFLSDNSQTNYQMQLTVSNSSGVGSGSTVYLNGSSLNWPYDIRFTNSSGGNLDYWIESNTSTTATVWVEFDAIPSHPNDGSFYMYWGKASDTNASNGSATFIFFDDFSGTLSKWTKEKNGANINIVSGYLNISGGTTSSPYGHTVLGSNASYTGFTNGIIDGKVYLATDGIAEVGYRGNYAANTGYKSRMDARASQGLGHLRPPYTDGTWNFIATPPPEPTGTAIPVGVWYSFSITVNGSALGISCAGQTLNGTDTSYAGPGEISLQNHYGNYVWFDDIRVRKYASTVPTASFGAEQTVYNTSSVNTIASDVSNTGHAGARWDLLGNSSSQPANTNITFEVRVSDAPFVSTNTTLAWQSISNYPNLYGQYQQWRATLSTTNGGVTPVLSEVRSLYSW